MMTVQMDACECGQNIISYVRDGWDSRHYRTYKVPAGNERVSSTGRPLVRVSNTGLETYVKIVPAQASRPHHRLYRTWKSLLVEITAEVHAEGKNVPMKILRKDDMLSLGITCKRWCCESSWISAGKCRNLSIMSNVNSKQRWW